MGRSSAVLGLAMLTVAAGCAEGGTRRTTRDAGGGPSDAAASGDAGRRDDAGATDGGTMMLVDAGTVGVDAGTVMDAGAPMDAGRDAGVDAGFDAGRDAGVDAGFDAGRDAGVDAGFDAGRDAGTSDAGAACAGGACTVSFPSVGDTRVTMLTNFWNMGDYVQGARTTTVPSTVGLTMHLVLEAVSLTCDTQDARVMVNGIEVGRFSARSGGAPVDATFSFARITGPTYTFRYETVRTVAGGCGSAGYSNTGSTITLVP